MVDLNRKNILITGGAGFIGSHLADALVRDHNVVVLDNFITSQELNIDHLLSNYNYKFIRHDLRFPIDLSQLPELEAFRVRSIGFHEIYHLACPTSPKYFNKYPIETALANSHATANALDIAVRNGAKFMLASSAAIYGFHKDNAPITEDYWGEVNPIGPRSSYDEGKRFAEALTVNYRHTYKIDAKIARIFKTFGPRMRLDDGRMIPDFIVSALNSKPLNIYGDEYLSATFCYIDDIVEGLIRLMNSDDAGPINLGSDHFHRVSDIAKRVVELTGSKSQVEYKGALSYPYEFGVPDITRAKESLGWFPLISIEDGLNKSIEYMKAHYRLYGIRQ